MTGVTVAPVRTPAAGLGHEVRAATVVWQREMIRFGQDRTRMLSSLVQPLLFLFVLGSGLSSIVRTGSGTVTFRTFLFPGVLATSVLFTAAFSGISMVWDREFGFLREMLVAPVSSAAILTGKCLGGATVATLQSLVILGLAGLVGVPYAPVMMAELVVLLFLMAFLVTAMGLLMAARIKQVQSAMPLIQMIIMPMMFLSGSLFPLSGLPGWLSVVCRLNPLTYAVEPLRAVVFARLHAGTAVTARLDPGLSWGGHRLSVLEEGSLVAVLAIVLLTLATLRFARTE
ncbi:MAG: ABC transporter permease [Actinomycetota bacterium]|nr:ABC transporter permease [Actinomycetota bacterium]